jgi:hypothetical protein
MFDNAQPLEHSLSMQAIIAFDYDRQKWVTGKQARTIRIAQLRQSLEVLNGPRGAEFCAFSGVRNPEQHKLLLCRELGELLTEDGQ